MNNKIKYYPMYIYLNEIEFYYIFLYPQEKKNCITI